MVISFLVLLSSIPVTHWIVMNSIVALQLHSHNQLK